MKTKPKRRKIKSIKCRPGMSYKHCWQNDPHVLLWTEAPAFNANPRGILIHRIKGGETFLNRDGSYSHDGVNYWCGNGTNGGGVNVTDQPPKDRLLCAHCERIAVEAGEKTAEQLTGRHVCVGELRAFRLCCKQEQN